MALFGKDSCPEMYLWDLWFVAGLQFWPSSLRSCWYSPTTDRIHSHSYDCPHTFSTMRQNKSFLLQVGSIKCFCQSARKVANTMEKPALKYLLCPTLSVSLPALSLWLALAVSSLLFSCCDKTTWSTQLPEGFVWSLGFQRIKSSSPTKQEAWQQASSQPAMVWEQQVRAHI